MVGEVPGPITFAGELRRRRTGQGFTLTELAGRINYSKSHLSKIESGVKRPSVDLARRCDQELNADGALARLVDAPSYDPPPETATPSEVWVMRMNADGSGEFTAFDRRTVLTAAASMMSWAIIPARGRPQAADFALPTFRTWLDQMRLLGQGVDPATMIHMLVGATNSIRALAAEARGETRVAALRLAARFAEYTGWMAQEQGDEGAAWWWTQRAVDLATSGGDHELPTYALVRRAELALYRDDSRSVVALAEQAEQRASSSRVAAFAAQRAAQGYALAGDDRACRQALDRAATLMTHAAGETSAEPALGSLTMRDPVAFTTGWCLFDLGRPAESAEILGAELDRLPATMHRTRSRYGARLALALANSGELERACEVLRSVLEQASTVDSATVRHDLRHLSRTLRRWRTEGAVNEAMPLLLDVLRRDNQPPSDYRL
ncbi:transcriptional regulator [Plantactinospora sp. BC1]|uniref:helix-turn-helix domain-containing protein n=1 Tax=Plantactinospora sp. BC1 TaxID=2108470 RepID=UPI000D15E15A|nr:helix-turn-helix transcriptional regulator [Plantactinospora sp. BC1]AVT34360.1 transcriptional regulator [Plantactinospora sp. BC1]AVT41277.1 transcriptional regulator [Plantactinospora sp. BB1]